MGRPRKPTKLLELNGSLKKHPDRRQKGEPKPEGTVGDPPAHFDDDQAKTWRELAGIIPAGVLGRGDRICLELAAVLLERFRRDPESFQGTKLNTLHTCLAKMGLTPADRSRVTTGGKNAENSFSKNRRENKPDPWAQF